MIFNNEFCFGCYDKVILIDIGMGEFFDELFGEFVFICWCGIDEIVIGVNEVMN